MPTLIEILIDYEPDMLEMIAEQWGIDQDLDPGKSQSKQIAKLLASEELIDEVLQAIPKDASNALIRLTQNKGRLPFDRFTREFGEIREMGAARRGKIRPDRNPQSTTEVLFYKSLIARAFFKQGKETSEFIFIPDEFLRFLDNEISSKHTASVPVLPGFKPARIIPMDDSILEHACTLLAAKRADVPLESITFENPDIPAIFLLPLLTDFGLLDKNGQALPKKIGDFLETPRNKAFSRLAQTWQHSQIVNEIQLLDSIEFEGSMQTNSASFRTSVLSVIHSLPNNNWIKLHDFLMWMKTYQPDLLRSGGDYDSWIIKDKSNEQYLKGFESWDKIEGALLSTLIRGPFSWMGLVELGAKTKTGPINLFRPSQWLANLQTGKEFQYTGQKKNSFILNKDGRIMIERNFPLSIRYQIARFCDWKSENRNRYVYQISHASLQNALRQGLQVNQLIKLISKYGKKPLPPNITNALERWKQNDLETVIERIVLLRVKDKSLLDQLINSQAKSYIKARLNDTTAIIKSESVNKLRDTLLDLGILADVRLEV